MNKPAVATMPRRIKVAVFVVFSLLTVAVVASQARSTEMMRYETDRQELEGHAAAPGQTLIVSRVGRLGARLVQSWRR